MYIGGVIVDASDRSFGRTNQRRNEAQSIDYFTSDATSMLASTSSTLTSTWLTTTATYATQVRRHVTYVRAVFVRYVADGRGGGPGARTPQRRLVAFVVIVQIE